MSLEKNPYIYQIRTIHKIIDGDTIDADIDLGFDICLTKRIRLAGIDTPESRTSDPQEKRLGLEAKDWLDRRLTNVTDIIIRTELPNSTEKYGRILGYLFLNGEATSVNEQMVNEGYAWAYDGTTKVKDFNQLLARRQNKPS